MVISITGILLYAKVSLLYNVLWECIVVVYKHFDRSLHVGSSDPTCVQNFRPVPLIVFEILGTRMTRRRIGEMDFLPYLQYLWSNSHQSLGACIY